MEKTDVLVIGGSAAGIVAAVTGKSNYPDKDFLIVRKEVKVVVPCGIPYVFGSLDSTDKNVIPDAGLAKAGVNLKVGQVVSIDQDQKVCKTDDGIEISFEKLILATGSITMALILLICLIFTYLTALLKCFTLAISARLKLNRILTPLLACFISWLRSIFSQALTCPML